MNSENVVDINKPLFTQVEKTVKQALDSLLKHSQWESIFAGISELPKIRDWSSEAWSTLDVACNAIADDLGERGDESLFRMLVEFSSRFREICAPSFGIQSNCTFLSIEVNIKNTTIKSPGVDDVRKQELKEMLLECLKNFPKVDSIYQDLQVAVLSNLVDNNTIHFLHSKITADSKLVLIFSVPAKSPSIVARAVVTMTFDFLPLMLDHLAGQFLTETTS